MEIIRTMNSDEKTQGRALNWDMPNLIYTSPWGNKNRELCISRFKLDISN